MVGCRKAFAAEYKLVRVGGGVGAVSECAADKRPDWMCPSRVAAMEPETLVVYRPKSLVVGVGSRRGVERGDELEKLLRSHICGVRDLAVRCVSGASRRRS